jgi:hypothetical protein
MSSAVIVNVTTCHTIPAVQLVRFVESEGYDGLRISRVVMRFMGLRRLDYLRYNKLVEIYLHMRRTRLCGQSSFAVPPARYRKMDGSWPSPMSFPGILDHDPMATGCRIALYPLTNDWVMI